ncbi:MAG TPA: hypothetical protein PLO31_04140 [Dysgonamonadaceae bacterium]|jgi:hypothetical protein|nr:hypothetical protein [Dysgonamonadaceae bacterium]
MNIREFINVCWLSVLLISCGKEDIYNPMRASVLHNGVLLSCVDSSNNDLLLNEDFIKQIKIYGLLSKKEIPFEIKEIEHNEIKRRYISFNAELPDEKSMHFNGGNEAQGTSTINLNIDNHNLTLLFSFKYSCSNSENFGGSIITIEEITYGKEKIMRQESHLFNSDIFFCLEKNDKDFTLK